MYIMLEAAVIVFGTGHRPEDSGHSYKDMFFAAQDFLETTDDSISVAVCGMAAGFDLAFGQAALSLEIPVWAVRPWVGHHPRKDDIEIYTELMKYAERRVDVNDAYTYPGPWVYQKRNEWMVDNSDSGVAWWSGKMSGGTYNCLVYARECDVTVQNIYPGLEGLINV